MSVSEFIKTPKTHEELHTEADRLTGLTGKKAKTTTPEQNELWMLVYDYLDFHANIAQPLNKGEDVDNG